MGRVPAAGTVDLYVLPRHNATSATEHIAGLELNYYYAGLTKITDRSLAILGQMPSLEQVDLYECNGVTDAGLICLAGLPRLREVHLDSLPGVTLEGTRVFPKDVQSELFDLMEE